MGLMGNLHEAVCIGAMIGYHHPLLGYDGEPQIGEWNIKASHRIAETENVPGFNITDRTT